MILNNLIIVIIIFIIIYLCICQKTKHVAEDKMGPYLTSLCLNGDGAEAAQLSVLNKAWRAAS